MSKILQGRVAIVTGAGRGIGQAIARTFAYHGAAVVVSARSNEEILETERLIRSEGGSCTAVSVDVAEHESVRHLIKLTLETYRSINILVNNAGIQGPIGPMIENDWQEWENTIRVNLLGTFLCSQAVLPTMISQKQGKIINLSGGGATSPRPNFSAYGASKAAIVRLTETMADELKEYNIQVNSIAPGAVNTKMLDEVLEAKERAGIEAEQALLRSREGGTPPTLAAELALFLASNKSDKITGKLVAAPHDGWQQWDDVRMVQLMELPWLTLRRIDPYTIKPFVDLLRSA